MQLGNQKLEWNKPYRRRQLRLSLTFATLFFLPWMFSNVFAQGGKLFAPLPGPQVKLTGKMLSNLPAGYRMNVRAKNYYTNEDLTFTRTNFLSLFGNGQFEIGTSSIGGGGFPGSGGVGVATNSSKSGSTSLIAGNTGARSNAIIKRDGLDPSKYGAYNIAGNHITFKYANGDVVQNAFKTDGHYILDIDDKRYFSGSEHGWERYYSERSNIGYFRTLDRSIRLTVDYVRSNPAKCSHIVTKQRESSKKLGLLVSEEPIKIYKTPKDRYTVVAGNHVRRYLKKDKLLHAELYARCSGSSKWLLISVNENNNRAANFPKILEFIEDVDLD